MGMKRIAVIGGGASGLMAAIMAARNGARVVVLERCQKPGRKLLSTGNGKCNFTNEDMGLNHFHCPDPGFVKTVLKQFSEKDTVRFFEALGMFTKSRNGGLYPRSEQARSVVDLLMMECRHLNIQILCDTQVTAISHKVKEFFIQTPDQTFRSDSLILAAGSKAAPKLGTDGSGYKLAAGLHHTITPVVPALVQMRCREKFFKQLAGVRTEATVRAFVENKLVAEDTGEVQLTEYGISGIPVFQVSRHLSMGVLEQKPVRAELDLMPVMDVSELEQELMKHTESAPHKSGGEFLTGIFNHKLIPVLLMCAGISLHERVANITPKQLRTLAKVCKNFPVTIERDNGFDSAQVCAGGVRTAEVVPETLESRLVDDLYITGELLDVDGVCGGYNLQWAWSTGYTAGIHAALKK